MAIIVNDVRSYRTRESSRRRTRESGVFDWEVFVLRHHHQRDFRVRFLL